MLATIYAANAMSVSVPLAGPGLAAAYLFRRFTRLGAGALLAGWALLAGGVISTVAWVLVLAGGGLASGHTVALAITVPCVAFAIIVTATVAVAARRPRLRAALEEYLTQALKHGARLLRWPATDPKLALGHGPNGSGHSAFPHQAGRWRPVTRWSTGSPTRGYWP